MRALAPGAITDVPGISVGHYTDDDALTGCTVILCKRGAVASGVVRGLAPGTRETDLLRPGTLVDKAHAVLLTGGSAFGLAAADGVMEYLEKQGIGYRAGNVRVPIVPAAVIMDLSIGDAHVRPTRESGLAACRAAGEGSVEQGNVGAGTGATVGKLLGSARCMKGGLGTASVRAGRLVVGAIAVVNALGDILDPGGGTIIAGARTASGDALADTSRELRSAVIRNVLALRNTVICAVATNARLDAAQMQNVAAAAHDGLARVVRPAHTLYDGDTVFALSTGGMRANELLVSDMAAEALSLAIVNGVLAAKDIEGIPCARSLSGE